MYTQSNIIAIIISSDNRKKNKEEKWKKFHFFCFEKPNYREMYRNDL